MSITSTTADDGSTVTISIEGKFDFQLYDDFRKSYVDTVGAGVQYIVDLSAADYLDSSALGMLLLLREHATVTVCHSRTADLPGECRNAEVLVVAIGKPEFVQADWIKPGAVVIDVGTNFIERDGKRIQVGDVAFQEAKEVAGMISPSPGGVGPMTIAMLLLNTLQAARWHVS